MKKYLLFTFFALAAIGGGFAQNTRFTIHPVVNVSETDAHPPFTITRIQPGAGAYNGELHLTIEGDIDGTARLLDEGMLQTQSITGSEDVETWSLTEPALSLWKHVACREILGEGAYIYHNFTLPYLTPLPAVCSEVTSTEHFFRAAPVNANSPDWRSFGIGLSPDFLWLIERSQ